MNLLLALVVKPIRKAPCLLLFSPQEIIRLPVWLQHRLRVEGIPLETLKDVYDGGVLGRRVSMYVLCFISIIPRVL